MTVKDYTHNMITSIFTNEGLKDLIKKHNFDYEIIDGQVYIDGYLPFYSLTFTPPEGTAPALEGDFRVYENTKCMKPYCVHLFNLEISFEWLVKSTRGLRSSCILMYALECLVKSIRKQIFYCKRILKFIQADKSNPAALSLLQAIVYTYMMITKK